MNNDKKFNAILEILHGTSVVKRWQTIRTYVPQSIAEHQYNVALLTMFFLDFGILEFDIKKISKISLEEIYPDVETIKETICYAMIHDHTEIYTGDLPAPVEKKCSIDKSDYEKVFLGFTGQITQVRERSHFVNIFVGIMDCLEAYIFIRNEGHDPRKKLIMKDLIGQIDKRIEYAEKIFEQYSNLWKNIWDFWGKIKKEEL